MLKLPESFWFYLNAFLILYVGRFTFLHLFYLLFILAFVFHKKQSGPAFKYIYDFSETPSNLLQIECELVKIDINCHIQGDVVLECISLNDDMELEEMMFRAVFNTAFIRSNILMLNRDEIDMLWDAKDRFPKNFRAEV
jgi:hypothetical protein